MRTTLKQFISPSHKDDVRKKIPYRNYITDVSQFQTMKQCSALSVASVQEDNFLLSLRSRSAANGSFTSISFYHTAEEVSLLITGCHSNQKSTHINEHSPHTITSVTNKIYRQDKFSREHSASRHHIIGYHLTSSLSQK
jgi:hypothetical protein